MSFVPTQHVQHVIAHYYTHNELNTVSGAYLLFPGDLTMEGFRLFSTILTRTINIPDEEKHV